MNFTCQNARCNDKNRFFFGRRLLVKIIKTYRGKNTSGPLIFVLIITPWKPKTKDYNIAAHSCMVFFFLTDYKTVLMQKDDVIVPSSVKQKLPLVNPYPTAFPYGDGMVLHFYQQQESSTTKTVHKVINKGLKTYV